MNQRRGGMFFIALFFGMFFSLTMVHAATLSPEVVGDTVARVFDYGERFFRPIAEGLLGNYTAGAPEGFGPTELLFVKVLIAILLYVVVYVILIRSPMSQNIFGSRHGIAIIVSAIISILAVRFMSSSGVIYGILLPYGTLGVTLAVLLPFLTFFFFVQYSGFGTGGRRLLWAMFGVVFFILWINRFSDLGEIANEIYIGMFIVLIILFVFDRHIHKYFDTARGVKLERHYKLKQLADIEADLNRYRAIPTPSAQVQRLIRELEVKYNALAASL